MLMLLYASAWTSISRFIQLAPCCCCVRSTSQSPCHAWGLWEVWGKGAAGALGLERHWEMLGCRWARWGFVWDRVPGSHRRTQGLRGMVPSKQGWGRAEVPPAHSLPHTRGCLWPGWGFRKVQNSKVKKQLWPTVQPFRHCQPTTIHVSWCQHMKHSSTFQRLRVCGGLAVRTSSGGTAALCTGDPDSGRKHGLVQEHNSGNKIWRTREGCAWSVKP